MKGHFVEIVSSVTNYSYAQKILEILLVNGKFWSIESQNKKTNQSGVEYRVIASMFDPKARDPSKQLVDNFLVGQEVNKIQFKSLRDLKDQTCSSNEQTPWMYSSHAYVQLGTECCRSVERLNAIVHDGQSYTPPAIWYTNESHKIQQWRKNSNNSCSRWPADTPSHIVKLIS